MTRTNHEKQTDVDAGFTERLTPEYVQRQEPAHRQGICGLYVIVQAHYAGGLDKLLAYFASVLDRSRQKKAEITKLKDDLHEQVQADEKWKLNRRPLAQTEPHVAAQHRLFRDYDGQIGQGFIKISPDPE
jgi:hypothetical protein